MKKFLSIILVITVVVNVLFSNVVFASSDGGAQSAEDIDQGINPGGLINDLDNSGQVTIHSELGEETRDVSETANLGSGIVVILVGIFFIPVYFVRLIMSLMINEGGLLESRWFYISDMLFGDIELFNINFFADNTSRTNNRIKENVVQWYYIFRTIAIMANLAILIYIGIRMAISTVAAEKAEYKKKFLYWFESIAIIFFLHYFIAILMFLSQELLNLISSLRGPNPVNIEEAIFNRLGLEMLIGNGWDVVGTFISYCVLVYYQVKFLLMYFKRLIVAAFLILISPIISITFAIDKVGNDKAEGFAAWRRELIINIFIQPLHAFLFLLFMLTAAEIVLQAPLMAAVFLFAISRGEKVIKNLFNFRGSKTISSMKKDKEQ